MTMTSLSPWAFCCMLIVATWFFSLDVEIANASPTVIVPVQIKCGDDFQCDNERCVPRSALCDEIDDCQGTKPFFKGRFETMWWPVVLWPFQNVPISYHHFKKWRNQIILTRLIAPSFARLTSLDARTIAWIPVGCATDSRIVRTGLYPLRR